MFLPFRHDHCVACLVAVFFFWWCMILCNLWRRALRKIAAIPLRWAVDLIAWLLPLAGTWQAYILRSFIRCLLCVLVPHFSCLFVDLRDCSLLLVIVRYFSCNLPGTRRVLPKFLNILFISRRSRSQFISERIFRAIFFCPAFCFTDSSTLVWNVTRRVSYPDLQHDDQTPSTGLLQDGLDHPGLGAGHPRPWTTLVEVLSSVTAFYSLSLSNKACCWCNNVKIMSSSANSLILSLFIFTLST